MATYGFCENKCKHELDTVKVSPTEPTTNEKVWIQKGKNLFNENLILWQNNCTYNNGIVTQSTADTNINLNWKIQTFKGGEFVSNPIMETKNDTGKISLTFTKFSTFNEVAFGLNGSQSDTLITFDGSKLINEETYTISFNITNVTQGSISWENIQIEQGSATEYEPYIDKKIYFKNDNDVYEEFINTADYKTKGDYAVVSGSLTLDGGSGAVYLDLPVGFTIDNCVIISCGRDYTGHGFINGTLAIQTELSAGLNITQNKLEITAYDPQGSNNTVSYKIVLMKI